jgi:hypothetical protein
MSPLTRGRRLTPRCSVRSGIAGSRATRPPRSKRNDGPGERVEDTQALVTPEVMKTEARFPRRRAEVVEVLVSPGDQVAPGTPSVVLG